MTVTAPVPVAPVSPVDRKTTAAAVVLLAGAALALINSTVANVAIPAMQLDLRLSPAGVSWALAGWALTYAVALVPAGWLGDRFGHRRILVFGLGLFIAASVATGLVQSETQLIVARLVQGAAGGLFYPAISATLSLLFHGPARNRVFGALGATIGAGAAIGPLLGGALLQWLGPDLGWRAVFFLNAPLGIAILVAALIVVPRLRSDAPAQRFDIVGFVLVTIGLAAALAPLIVGQNLGWPAWTWLVLSGGIALLLGFVAWERAAERRSRATIIAPSMFRDRDFSITVVLGLTQFAGFISIFYVLALLWQTGLGRSALEMGFLTLPEALASIVGAILVAPLTARVGSRGAVIIGSMTLAVGLAFVALVPAVIPAASLSIAALLVPLIITGLGSGLAISATLNHALAVVDPARAGAASGVVATVQRVGNALGLAVVGGVFFTVLGSAQSPDDYARATTVGLCVCVAVTVVGAVLSLFLRRVRPAAAALR